MVANIGFSVVIPTYNRSWLLFQTLQSLANQTFRDFEVIVVDDGSTDDTAEVVAAFATKMKISYHKLLTNSGEGFAVNTGWEMATKSFVAVVNSDDPQTERWLETMAVGIADNPDYGFYYPNRIVIDSKNKIKSFDFLHDWSKSILYGKMIPIASAGLVVRRNSLPDGYKPRRSGISFPSDLLQMLELGRFADGLRLEEAWGVWRDHESSISGSTSGINKPVLFKRNLFHWINQNIATVSESSELASSYAYIYAQSMRMDISEVGIYKSFLNLINRDFLLDVIEYPKMLFYFSKMLIHQLGAIFRRKPDISIKSEVFCNQCETLY